MGRSRHTRRIVAAILTLLVHLSARAAFGQQPALLDLSVNRVPHGQVLALIEGPDVWAVVATLEEAGLKGIAGDRRTWNGKTLVRLGSLSPSVNFEFDERELALRLTVVARALPGTAIDLLDDRPRDIEYRRAPSAFVNYGGLATTAGTGSLSLEAGASAGGALVTSTAFADHTGAFRRGLTALTIDDRHRMNRYAIGDAVASTGVLGGAIELAGVTVSRDFSLDPYFIRLPTIGLSGAALTPSRVEIYVNNQLVRVEQLPAGVYQLNHLPLPVGTADTRVVVRDAFGGEQSYASSYYISQNVLGRGIQQFAYSAGAERLEAFDSSWSYGQPMLLGLHRIGVTDALTVGGRIEADSTLASGGPMITAQLGRLGQVETVAALSHGRDGGGYAASLAYEYVGRSFSVSTAARHMSADYTTLSTALEPLRPRLDAGASATSRVGARVTAGISWQSVDYYLGAPSLRRGALTGSITVSRRLSLYVSASQSLIQGRWSTGVFTGLGVALSSREMANVSAERDRGIGRVTADVQRSLPVGTGYGYRVQSAAHDTGAADFNAELQAQAPFGRFDVTQAVVAGQAETMANVSGGLVFIGGGVHATRAVQDGFALVRVPDVPNVRTYLSHQEVGRTNRNGDSVVPNLLPYYGNQLSIADSDVPLDRDVPRTEMTLAPPYRGGAIALFPMPRPWRLTGRIVVMRGAEVITPAEWQLRITTATGAVESTIGDDGTYYVEGVPPGDYSATVTGSTFDCRLSLHVPESRQPVMRLGVATCSAVVERPRP